MVIPKTKIVFISKWRYREEEEYQLTNYYYNARNEYYCSNIDNMCFSHARLKNINMITFPSDYHYCYHRFKLLASLDVIDDIKLVIWMIFKEILNNYNLSNGFRPIVTDMFSKY